MKDWKKDFKTMADIYIEKGSNLDKIRFFIDSLLSDKEREVRESTYKEMALTYLDRLHASPSSSKGKDCRMMGDHDCPDCKHEAQEGDNTGSWCVHCKKDLTELSEDSLQDKQGFVYTDKQGISHEETTVPSKRVREYFDKNLIPQEDKCKCCGSGAEGKGGAGSSAHCQHCPFSKADVQEKDCKACKPRPNGWVMVDMAGNCMSCGKAVGVSSYANEDEKDVTEKRCRCSCHPNDPQCCLPQHNQDSTINKILSEFDEKFLPGGMWMYPIRDWLESKLLELGDKKK